MENKESLEKLRRQGKTSINQWGGVSAVTKHVEGGFLQVGLREILGGGRKGLRIAREMMRAGSTEGRELHYLPCSNRVLSGKRDARRKSCQNRRRKEGGTQ